MPRESLKPMVILGRKIKTTEGPNWPGESSKSRPSRRLCLHTQTASLPSLAWHLVAPPFPCQNPSDQPPGSAFFLLPLVSSLIPTGPEYACTPNPSRPQGPASLFSSETANPQLSFSPFCSGPGHQSHLLMSGPNPPPPRSASVLPVWPSQVSVTAGAVLPAFAFGLFPRQLHPQSPPSSYTG